MGAVLDVELDHRLRPAWIVVGLVAVGFLQLVPEPAQILRVVDRGERKPHRTTADGDAGQRLAPMRRPRRLVHPEPVVSPRGEGDHRLLARLRDHHRTAGERHHRAAPVQVAFAWNVLASLVQHAARLDLVQLLADHGPVLLHDPADDQAGRRARLDLAERVPADGVRPCLASAAPRLADLVRGSTRPLARLVLVKPPLARRHPALARLAVPVPFKRVVSRFGSLADCLQVRGSQHARRVAR